jgi:predicted kinase
LISVSSTSPHGNAGSGPAIGRSSSTGASRQRTGKSALSEALGDRLGFTVINGDRIRKELAGVSPEVSAAAEFGTGIYTALWTRRTYAEMIQRAARLLAYGESVILNASWTAAQLRADAATLAEHADLTALNCHTHLAEERLLTRPHGVSDADPAIAARMAETAAPWPDAIPIDTSGPVGESVESAYPALPGQALAAALPSSSTPRWIPRVSTSRSGMASKSPVTPK